MYSTSDSSTSIVRTLERKGEGRGRGGGGKGERRGKWRGEGGGGGEERGLTDEAFHCKSVEVQVIGVQLQERDWDG